MSDYITDRLPVDNEGERHVAAVLLVDASSSTQGEPNAELNRGLIEFGEALKSDPLARGRADVCIISFNSSVQTEVGFRPADKYEAPVVSASGLTAMNEAIEAGLDALEARKAEYRTSGVYYYRPWLFLLTDGAPTDSRRESAAMDRLQKAIRNKKVMYMPMGIGANADISKLQQYYPPEAQNRPVLTANINNFKEAFVWLSNSISAVTRSDPSIATQIESPPLPSSIALGI